MLNDKEQPPVLVCKLLFPTWCGDYCVVGLVPDFGCYAPGRTPLAISAKQCGGVSAELAFAWVLNNLESLRSLAKGVESWSYPREWLSWTLTWEDSLLSVS